MSMTAIHHRETAQIIPFPIKPRPAPAGRFESAKSAADPRSAGLHDAAFGSGWYHEAAITENEPTRRS